MRSMRGIGGAALAIVLLAMSVPGAIADPGAASHVDSMTASVGSSTVAVAGQATFVDIPKQIATDAPGDALVPAIGADLVSGGVARPDPVKNELRFTLGIGDSINTLFGVPEVVHYSFFFATGVDGADGGYLLQALRSAQVQASGNVNPFFRLMRFRGDGTCCDPVRVVPGTMAAGAITWTILLADLSNPSVIVAHPGATRQVQVQLGASGQQWLNSGQPDFMTIENEYGVPSRVVKVGIAPAGTDPASVALTTTGTVNAANAFSAQLPRPATPGSYVVVAQACFGAGSCGLSSTTITV